MSFTQNFSSTTRFRLNSPAVSHQMIDDEVIIVNLDSGFYYNLQKVAAHIWNYVLDHSLTQTIEMVQGDYEGDSEYLRTQTLTFIEEVCSQGLLIPITEDSDATASDEIPSATPVQKLLFETPKLESHSELSELLLLDPIHDVDEAGWPLANS